MAKKVLVNLDMHGNEIQNVVMQNLATAPTSPKVGQYYYNSASKKAFQWDGSAWKPLGGAEIVVDDALSSTSTNPVQNKAVSTGLVKSLDSTSTDSACTIKGKAANGSEITSAEIPAATDSIYGVVKVDSALKTDSVNPVQNKVINSALGDKANQSTVDALDRRVFSLETDISFMPADISATSGATAYLLTLEDANGESLGAGATISQATSTNVGVVKIDPSVTASGKNPVTGKAIYDYVGDAIAASDAMIFKGTIGTGGTVTALPTTYKTGWTYRVITAGTYAGQKCEVGDLIIALVDRDGTGNLDSDWTVAQTNIDGAITDISATTPITVSGSGTSRTIGHTNSGVTAGSYGLSSNATPAFGATFDVPYVTVDAKGHVTSGKTNTVTIPNSTASSSSAGLMSADAYNKLYSLVSSSIQTKTGTLSTGSKTLSLPISPTHPAEIINVSVRTPSGETVVTDVDIDPSGSTVDVTIAQGYSTDLMVTVWYTVTE